MKRLAFVVLAVVVAAGGVALAAYSAGEDVEVKQTVKGDTVTTTETVKGPDVQSRTKTAVTTKEREVTVKKIEKVTTPDGTGKIKSETVVSDGGVAKRIKIDTTKEAEGRQRVEAGSIVTPDGDKIAFAKVSHEGREMGRIEGKFVEYNQDDMTIIVEKGNYEIVLPTAENDRWRIRPDAMKKGDAVVIYSTYDPKLIQHIVRDAEAGKTIGKQ